MTDPKEDDCGPPSRWPFRNLETQYYVLFQHMCLPLKGLWRLLKDFGGFHEEFPGPGAAVCLSYLLLEPQHKGPQGTR